MFERYTEKARRVIFFARYEASQYGSPQIESEHLLLGVVRENKELIRTALPKLESPGELIRAEIETVIERRERISTTVEVPLTQECKHILNFAFEEADRLGQKHVGTDHLLLGILNEEKSLAARILTRHGGSAEEIRQRVAGHPSDHSGQGTGSNVTYQGPPVRPHAPITAAVEQFLSAWTRRDSKGVAELFMVHGQLWDVNGELWHSLVEIERGFAGHFSASGPAQAPPDVRDIKMVTGNAAVVTLVWEPRGEAMQRNAAALRIVLVLYEADPHWRIVSAHLTSLPPEAPASAQ